MTTQDHMSAEDRVAEFLNRWRADGRVAKSYDPSKDLVDVIKAAENDALERAAGLVFESHSSQIATEIRSLKHKATP